MVLSQPPATRATSKMAKHSISLDSIKCADGQHGNVVLESFTLGV
jgi:hypothetical protein